VTQPKYGHFLESGYAWGGGEDENRHGLPGFNTAICRTIETASMKGNTMPQLQTARAARLEARISPALKRRLEYAASLRGSSLTEFVVQSAQEAATRTIRENEVLTLSEQASIAFAEFLLNPPGPNEKAMAAANRYKALLGKEIVSE
jgi:uncharacterized protein (DUF1778 family)